MFLSQIEIKNFRKLEETTVDFQNGVNALVGENNSGKTAIIDAIRFCLGYRADFSDRVTENDFNDKNSQIEIQCCFSDLSQEEQSKFLPYLTYDLNNKNAPSLYVNVVYRQKNDGRVFTDKSTGKNKDGEAIEQELLDAIFCSYLKPLRDAESELSAKKNSRLSRLLLDRLTKDEQDLLKNSVKEAFEGLFKEESDINKTKEKLQSELKKILFDEEKAPSLSPAEGSIQNILERFSLSMDQHKDGLGYQNILFMLSEIELQKTSNLILIEEPEAHLHPQLQLSFMRWLEERIKNNPSENQNANQIQIILSTHSVSLASKIPVEQLIVVKDGKAYSLAKGKTKLTDEGTSRKDDDYKFLSKFLDATKANLFFARGVLFVEGISEQILIPAIAEKLGFDLAQKGVSVVAFNNKGSGTRYLNIFKQKDGTHIPVKVCWLGDKDEEASSDDKGADIRKILIPNTLETYLMNSDPLFKNKILELCKPLRPNTNLTDNDTPQNIYKACFKGKTKISKSEIALQLSIWLNEDDDKENKKAACEKLADIKNAIEHVCS